MSIIAETVVIGKRSKNSSSITATTVTVASGGKNIGEITVTGTVTVVGTNSGAVIGSVILDGGTNTGTVTGNVTMSGGSNTGTVTGNVTMSGGSNTGTVTGNVTMTAGINTGTITGDLYVLSQAAINQASVAGSIIAASGINLSPTVPTGYTGNVIQVLGTTLTTTPYTAGSAGTPVTAPDSTYYNLQGDSKAYTYTSGNGALFNGLLYNLQGDSKAYTYTAGQGAAFSGPAYNLTGDSKAYSWASGVKGSLYSGSIGSDNYTNGELDAPTSASFTVTGGVIGTLYTASGGSVTTGPVYSNSALETLFTGFFIYDSANYYSEAGTPNTYRAWSVSEYSNFGTLYTAAHDDVTTDTVYTGTALDSEYEGVFAYDNLTYYATTGTPVQYLSYAVTDDSNGVNPGFLYSLVGFNAGPTDYLYTEPALVNKYTGFYLSSQGFYAEDGVVNTYRAWTITGNNAVTVIYTAPDALDITSGNHQVYGDPALETPYNDFYEYGSLIYSGATPALLTGVILYHDSNQDIKYRYVDAGVVGGLFTGAYYDGTNYRLVTAGVRNGSDLANGVLLLDSDQKYYTFDSANGTTAVLFTGAYYDGTYYKLVTDGVRDWNFANGVLLLASDQLYYTFNSGIRTTAVLFTGAYYDGTYYKLVAAGVRDGSYLANGVLQLDSDQLYYTFDNTGNAGTLFNGVTLHHDSKYHHVDAGVFGGLFTGAYYTGAYYRPVTDGVRHYGSWAADGVLQLDSDVKYYTFPGTGNAGTLFTGVTLHRDKYRYVDAGVVGALFNGAWLDGSYYRLVTNGARDGAFANGVLQLDSDVKYYTFDGVGGIGGPFTGAYYDGATYKPVTAGVRDSNNFANGVLLLDSDQLYYTFDNTGNAGVLCNGAWLDDTYYRSVTAGERVNDLANGVLQLDSDLKYYTFDSANGTTAALFTGAYYTGAYYRPVTDGVRDINNLANGVLLLDSDRLYYTFDSANGTTAVLFTGAWLDGSYYRLVTNGARDGAFANGVLQLDSDLKYYTFNSSYGTTAVLFNGVTLHHDSKYHHVDAGVVGGLFNGAYYEGLYFLTHRPVIDGVQYGSDVANGVLQLDSDLKYYTFNGGGIGAPFTGVTLHRDKYRYVDAGVVGGLFTGAYYDGTNYRPVTAGERVSDLANGVLLLDSDQLYYTFDGEGDAGTLFTGATLHHDSKYRYVDTGVVGGLFNGAYYDGTNYRPVTEGEVEMNSYVSGIRILLNDGTVYLFDGNGSLGQPHSGAYRASNGKYYVASNGAPQGTLFEGTAVDFDGKVSNFDASGEFTSFYDGAFHFIDNTYHYVEDGVKGAGFNGAAIIAGNYTAVVNGVPGHPQHDFAAGLQILFSDLKYYTFDVFTPTVAVAFNGAVNIGGSYYSVIDGVIEATATFNGATDAGGYYTFVTNGTDTGSYAQGVLILDSDGLYYNFTGNGVISTAPATGIVNVGGSYYYVTEGVRETTATVNAVYYNVSAGPSGTYFNISSGELTDNPASGVGLLVSDMKYYIFSNSGYTAVLLNGAWLDGAYYRPVTNGARDGSNFANGVLQLDSDQKYYTFDSLLGGYAALFTGAWYDGTYYRPVTAGVRDGGVAATGVLQLDSDLKYYTFNGDGTTTALLAHGGASYNGKWYNVLNGERQSSYFTYGVVASSGQYYTVDSNTGTVSDSQPQHGGMYMLYDGTWYTFLSAIPTTAVTPSNYTTYCDQTAGSGIGDEFFLAVQGTNLGDRVVQIGIASNGNTVTHTIPQVPSTTFVVSGLRYGVDTNGVIDDIYTCTEYAD